ncbi:MAG TPA: isoleucine--tRNA ligase [Solirubrobacteraceae bacterium]|nr:isoleucine--tRNA ligase [Solirubrobacteraceae bacterium]
MPPFRPLPESVSFPQLEEGVLERWREHDVFGESVRRRQGAEPWVFYEGPPTANGRPGSHHVLARVFKDVFPRYQTMRGRYVERKGGWDCHGLPVEVAVEQRLGFKNKKDIEEYGIAEFNRQCRESVFEFLEDWTALTERIGYWVDLEHPYRTLDAPYMESVWWALRQLWDKELLYEGFKVVPYCPRDGTALSSHEVAQGYRDVEDPSIFVRFPVTSAPEGSALRPGDTMLVWTTTPWTLVSNAAVAVDPELTYVRTTDGSVLAEPLVERVLGEGAVVVDRFPGERMVGAAYEPPFGFIAAAEYGEKGHTVLAADFVSAEDGTGIVHTAIAFGADDFRLGEENGLDVVNPVRPDGTFDERIGPYAGRWVKDADDDLIAELEARGRVLRAERLLHAYPHCWRCGTPLLYYARASWYIRTTALRDRLLAANETVDWHPEHIKHGRFGRWLENNVDWALSRERYWGTPLPVWRCANGHAECMGSFAEVEGKAGAELPDPHRPYVDELTWDCAECGEPMRRVPEVIDAWFDSGSMPFAQHHAPFENGERFDAQYPANYICEGIDQTRGWFYSLLAISTLLFDRSPYETVLCLGHIADPEGKKMSKSLGNIVAPWDVIERHGADAFRWYFLTSKQPWEGYGFDVDTVGDALRQFLLQLWNTYGFLVLYANANDVEQLDAPPSTDLDRWALSRLGATIETVREYMDAFDATRAGQAIAGYVDELSNWYVRRSRRRFWDGDPAAIATLRTCLLGVSKLLAPFCPFLADEIYGNLDGAEPSVHLCDFPEAVERDRELEAAMEVVRETVRLGLAARGQSKLKVRQPLRAAVVVAAGAEREAIERLSGTVLEELNVKELRYVAQADELGSYEVKPNYRALGPRFGKQMPQVAAAVASLAPAHVAGVVRGGGRVGINVDGHDHELDADDLLLAMRAPEGYQLEREGSHAVALELELDDGLRREGIAREVVHAVQNARKAAGLQVEDRIELALGGDGTLLEAVREHEAYLAGETLALAVSYENGLDGASEATIEGRPLTIAVRRAASEA